MAGNKSTPTRPAASAEPSSPGRPAVSADPSITAKPTGLAEPGNTASKSAEPESLPGSSSDSPVGTSSPPARRASRPAATRSWLDPDGTERTPPGIIPVAKVQFKNDAIPAIPGIGSQTVLIGAKQKAREKNPSTVSRTVELTYRVAEQLLAVGSTDKDGTA